MTSFLKTAMAIVMALTLMIFPCITVQQTAKADAADSIEGRRPQLAMIGNRPFDPPDQPQECSTSGNCEPGTESRAVLTNVRIVLRAGHGGKDTGAARVDKATGTTVYEKVITLQVVERLHKMLAELGATVEDARPNGDFRGLNWSSYLANDSNADFFISVHVNSMPDESSDASGIETYYFTDQSLALAQTIHAGEIKGTGAVNRGVIKHGWYEVRMTKCPAILTEIGFITNDTERKLLTTPEYQTKVARSIADACAQYWIEVMRKAGKRATTPASPLPPAAETQNVPTVPDTQSTTPNAPQSSKVPAKLRPANFVPSFMAPHNTDLSAPLLKKPATRKKRVWFKRMHVVVPESISDDEPMEPEQGDMTNDEVTD